MTAQFTGVSATIGDLEKAIDALEAEAVEEMKRAARIVTEEFFVRTPVWSGRTVRNYAWGADGASGAGGEIEPIGGPGYVPGRGSRAQKEEDPGPTNSMGLGPEPRRAENEAAAQSEMESVLGGVQKLGTLTLSNNSSIWDLVDNGSAPTGDRSRAPGGVSALAEQAAKSKLGDCWE